MPREGNWIDDAPIGSLFSHLKAEWLRHLKIVDFDQAARLIDDPIHFYNYDHIQLNTKLTSFELRCQFV
jgi:hypothetical protein